MKHSEWLRLKSEGDSICATTRLLPNAQRYTVARFCNRQDAEDYRRFLNRFMPAAEFQILFDVPNEKLQRKTLQTED